MSEKTNIAWAHSTYNPHRGCRKVSLECENCYIVDTPPLRRIGQKHGSMRVRASDKVLNSPYEWDEKQRRDWDNWEHICNGSGGQVPPEPQWRVFCMSLGDWLDDENVPIDWTWRTLRTVMECEHLTWLMLTKRSQNFKPRLTAVAEHDLQLNKGSGGQFHKWLMDWLEGRPPNHVWFGGSIINGKVPQALLDVPARVRWLSAEPLLPNAKPNIGKEMPLHDPEYGYQGEYYEIPNGIHWAVVGGESGADGKRRDCGVDAITCFARTCEELGIPVFVKQDCHRKPGQQGRIPDEIWTLKQFPKV
jgi:protein gp37